MHVEQSACMQDTFRVEIVAETKQSDVFPLSSFASSNWILSLHDCQTNLHKVQLRNVQLKT